MESCTPQNVEKVLSNDTAVKVGGIDVDGVLRGKMMAKSKFLSLAKDDFQFGFCSVIFGWDMHDQTYIRELKISNKDNGYRDVIAQVDLQSFRRIPWEDDVALFLVKFIDPDSGHALSACPRSLLGGMVKKLATSGVAAFAGAEYEFHAFESPGAPARDPLSSSKSTATARFLKDNAPHKLQSLTEGMHGYSLYDPIRNKDWYRAVYDQCLKFGCEIEGWHTESGPGVFEAALSYGAVSKMADNAALFKFATKNISSLHGITPCFMAKPKEGLPGNSGHMHVSLVGKSDGKNLLARDTEDKNATYPDLVHLSDLGRHFLAGLLKGLPDIMPLAAPNVNSYKRLVENFWAPVTVSWGLEHRAASIRLIAPPTCSPKATRFEVRVPGADANPHYVLAAIVGCGWRGVEKKLEIKVPPLGKGEDTGGEEDKGARLAKSLKESNERFMAKDSVAREVFGDEFVEHYGGTREHEVRLWEEAVTDWEVRRYIEMV